MNTSTEKLVMAMRVLAAEIQSDDGVANAAIHEAALRLEQQNDKIKRLEEFVNRFLNPSDLGWAIGKHDRDEAREALGIEIVESKVKG